MPIYLCATHAEPNHPDAKPARSIDLAILAPDERAARNAATDILLRLSYATTHLYSDTVVALLDQPNDSTFDWLTWGPIQFDWLGRPDDWITELLP